MANANEAQIREEQDDLRLRAEYQQKLQEAIRRSAGQAELRKIQQQIEALNQKIESRSNRIRRP